jgi:putative ABC transport system ATP-binding protein
MIGAGEFVMVTGPSGSGKTTLLHLAALLDRPTAGRIAFQGRNVSALSERELCEMRKRGIGMVFQRSCLLPHRSARDNVAFRFRYLDGAEPGGIPDRVEEALGAMELSAVSDRPARVLSAGEAQRVAIARAVVAAPALLVADEPTGNLNREAAETVMRLLTKLNRQGMTILMVTHNEALLAYCSRRLRCQDGMLT